MGIFDWFKKKKEPEFDFEKDFNFPGHDARESVAEQRMPSAFEPRQDYGGFEPESVMPSRHREMPTSDDRLIGKDLEVISAKLDSIRVTLEAMNNRLAALERIASGENRGKYF